MPLNNQEWLLPCTGVRIVIEQSQIVIYTPYLDLYFYIFEIKKRYNR